MKRGRRRTVAGLINPQDFYMVPLHASANGEIYSDLFQLRELPIHPGLSSPLSMQEPFTGC